MTCTELQTEVNVAMNKADSLYPWITFGSGVISGFWWEQRATNLLLISNMRNCTLSNV